MANTASTAVTRRITDMEIVIIVHIALAIFAWAGWMKSKDEISHHGDIGSI